MPGGIVRNLSFEPFSPIEREKLKQPCRELGINMDNYSSDQALEEAITGAVLAEFAAEQNPEAGYYEI
jgi:hypothetical protein